MNRFTKALPALIILALASPAIWADSVAQPPSEVRTWELAATITAAYTRFTKTTSGGTQTIVSKSILFISDEATGGDDAYIDVSGGTAAAPTAGGTSFRLKPGESIRCDGQFSGISITSEAGTVDVRVDVTF